MIKLTPAHVRKLAEKLGAKLPKRARKPPRAKPVPVTEARAWTFSVPVGF